MRAEQEKWFHAFSQAQQEDQQVVQGLMQTKDTPNGDVMVVVVVTHNILGKMGA